MSEWFEEIIEKEFLSIDMFDDDIEEDVMINCDDEEKKKFKERNKRRYINREFERFNDILVEDYFCENPRYNEEMFRRRFRMPSAMFLRICEDLSSRFEYFTQRVDAVGRKGLSTIQKCTSAVRMLAYGLSADAVDEYLKIAETTNLQILRAFCESICTIYGEHYLRTPNEIDKMKLLEQNEKRGFPGMLASIDCTSWNWKNCPMALKGQYQGKSSEASVVLEVLASCNLHIWHAYFGLPGSCNDINVLDRSPIIHEISEGELLNTNWTVNGSSKTRGYLLADGIYPDWPIFLKTINDPRNQKEQYFAEKQESVRKDVERAFGVLLARWHILCNPCRLWDVDTMAIIMRACIILHNMILEYEYEDDEIGISTPPETFNVDKEVPNETFNHPVDVTEPGTIAHFFYMMNIRKELKDSAEYFKLREEICNHLWTLKGSQ